MKEQTQHIHGWSPLEIRNALYRADLNQAAVARELNVSPAHISKVIDGITASRRVHEAIAKAIGEDIKRIWPNIYLIPGRARKRGRPAKSYKPWHRQAAQG